MAVAKGKTKPMKAAVHERRVKAGIEVEFATKEAQIQLVVADVVFWKDERRVKYSGGG